MKEQLISFETAKLAKEKGFDVPVDSLYSMYSNNNVIIDNDYLRKYNKFDKKEYIKTKNWNLKKKFTSAPTQSLLQKWLREVYNISVNPIPNFKTNLNQYHLGIVFINKGVVDATIIKSDAAYKTTVLFDSYEEALEKGLQEALKLIK